MHRFHYLSPSFLVPHHANPKETSRSAKNTLASTATVFHAKCKSSRTLTMSSPLVVPGETTKEFRMMSSCRWHQNYTHGFPKCFRSLHTLLGLSFCVPRYQFTCCQCTKLIHFLTCTRIPCRGSYCENGRVRCCIHTPRRLQQTAVSCKRSNCNKPKTC